VSDSQTLTSDEEGEPGGARPIPESLALAIAWYPTDPRRIGEVAILPPARQGAQFILGRGRELAGPDHARVEFAIHRAGLLEVRPALASAKISRRQLLIEPRGTAYLSVQNVGRCPLLHNGVRVDSASVEPGHTLQLGQELLLVCVRRAAWLRSLPADTCRHAFGCADEHGLVGESPAEWELRYEIAFIAPRTAHVLIVGESGTGKELVARAIHAQSARAARPFVSRNAATFPEGLVDAELFGHARNYPNPGMPERQGLIGVAHRSTLFLDEIAELPPNLQTHLLRVLDAGEFQRLGDSTLQTSDFRLIAATNQPERLREDMRARFKLSMHLAGLNERLEDIPLLLVHLLRQIAASNDDIRSRIFPEGHVEAVPRVSFSLVDALLRHRYATHVRELEALIWDALGAGADPVLTFPRRRRTQSAATSLHGSAGVNAAKKRISREELTSALEAHAWSLNETWKRLGLSSRHALARLMNKHGIRRPR